MAFRPTRSLGTIPTPQQSRVARISQWDLVNPAPDTLTCVKREVHTLDLLEVSDPEGFTTKVNAIADARTKQLFFGDVGSRIRYRYAVYGMEHAVLQQVLFELAKVNYSGIITAWLRLQSSSQSGGAWTNWADELSSNHAVQSDVDRRAAAATSLNGLPIATFDAAGDDYVWPLVAENNGTVTTGLYVPIKPVSVTGVSYTILAIANGSNGASARKLIFETVNNTLRVRVNVDAANIRQAVSDAVLSANVGAVVGLEYNGGLPLEVDKCAITLNGVPLSLTFSNSAGSPGAMPATLVSVTGNAIIGGFNDSDTGTNQLVGNAGPGLVMLGAAMAGVTSGLLNTQARQLLNVLERAS